MTVYAEMHVSANDQIAVKTEYRHKDLIQQIPGSRYHAKSQVWLVPVGWTMCLALRAQFGSELVIGPNLLAWSMAEYESRILPCLNLRQALDAEGPSSLYGYQRAGVQFLAAAKRALLADEMGTGKTRQAYSAIATLYQRGENPFPVLIVAPNSTKIPWQREADQAWPGLKVNVIAGSAAKRRKLLSEKAHVYVMNWEGLRGHSRLAPFGSIALKKCIECGGTNPEVTITQCETHLRELNHMVFNTVIGDEIHRAKDPSAKQTRAFWAATGDAKFRFGLSGTPIANTPDDLWSILHWLSPEEWPSKVKYIDRFCDVSYNAFGSATVVGIKRAAEQEFFSGLDPRLRRMPKDLVLSYLPPIRYERRDVEMSPKQNKAYTQMRDQMLVELDDDEKYVTTSALVKATRMLQFASSYAELVEVETFDELGNKKVTKHVKLTDPSCKLDAFINDIDDFAGNSVVVFAVSRQLIEMLSARLEKLHIPHGLITGAQSGEERQHHIDNFQAGHTRFILCTVAAGGTGITLTKGSVAVFLQRSWSMIDNVQAEARVHRIGSEQHDSILILDYVTDGTIEEDVIEAVLEKGERLEQILRDRALLRKVLSER